MNRKLFFQRRRIWRVGIFCIDQLDEIFNLHLGVPIKLIGEIGIRKGFDFIHTYADPFLYTHNGNLFLFYETKTDFRLGRIEAKSLDENGNWTDHGVVIEEKFHMSYPQVFSHKDRILMVPETAGSGCLWLYEGIRFPFDWKRQRVLINKPLKDASVYITKDGVFILGTTEEEGLSLYFGNDFESEFKCIHAGITQDTRYCRNAGSLFRANRKVYRPFQDCSQIYGESLGFAVVDSITQSEYGETVILKELLKKRPDWMQVGYHHISIASFNDKIYVALDGMCLDRYLNTVVYALFRLIDIIWNGLITIFKSRNG